MTKKTVHPRILLPLLLCLAWPALAQQSRPEPDAQEFLRQQERERVLREQQQTTPDVRLERPVAEIEERLPQDETPCFNISHITLEGDSASQFQWALRAANPATDPAIGRCLGAEGINITMKRVQNAIVARGYVTTRILAVPQDLQTGHLVLTVIPGRIHSIRFTEESSPRATVWNALPANPGDILNLRDIEQALENLKRVPTAEADIQITPATDPDAQPGTSDLVISWQQAFPFRLNLSADDSGSRSTGKYQGNVTVSYDHALTLNDLFYVSFNQDMGGGYSGNRGSDGHTVHYEIPYGYWLLGVTAGSHDYHQTVAGTTQSYIYSGKSNTAEIQITRLVYRDAARKSNVYLQGWKRDNRSYVEDMEIMIMRREMAGWEAGITHREFIGNAILDASIAYRRGTGALGAMPAPEEDLGTETSRPKIIKANAQLSIPFQIGEQSMRYQGSWRAQWNRTPLVSQDHFSIGGRFTVRGFDGEMTLAAERGWLIRNDLGIILAGQELYLGVDYGSVGGYSSHRLVGTELAGGVIGVRGAYHNLNYDIFIGEPIKQPDHFQTKATVTGFSLNLQF